MAITALIGAAAAGTAVMVGAATLTAIAVGIGAAAVFDYMMDSMAIDDASVDTMGNRVSTGKDANASRKIVYGLCRVGGTIVYQTTSSDNKYLHSYIVFCEGEIGHLVNIYFNDDLAWSWQYDETEGEYVNIYRGHYLSPNSNGRVGRKTTIFHRTGSANQPAISLHVPGNDAPTDWDSTSKLNGMCYAYVRLEHDAEVFPNGFPNITALIQGKHIYDPRYDNTQSAWYETGNENRGTYGNQGRYDNNAALVLLDYMMSEDYGLGESLDSFDPDTTIAAIEACEEQILRADDNSYVSRQFTCNGIVDTKNSHKKNIQNILTSMNGQLLYSSGKFHIKPYVYQAPHSQIVTEDMLIGSFDVSTKQSRRDMFNRVKGKFNSGLDNYKLTEYPVQISTVDTNTGNPNFEDDDGETLITTYDLPFTTKQETAQRLARLTLLRSRMQNTIKFTTNAKGLVYTVGDTIKVANETLGYSLADPKIYKIQKLQVMPDAEKGIAVKIEAKEDSQNIYDWDTDDLEDFDTGTTVAVDIGTLSPPTDLIAIADGHARPSPVINLSWNPSTTVGVQYLVSVFQTQYDGLANTRAVTATVDEPFISFGAQEVEYRIRVYAVKGERRSTYIERTIYGEYHPENNTVVVDDTVDLNDTQQVTEAIGNSDIVPEPDTEVTVISVDGNGVEVDEAVFVQETTAEIHASYVKSIPEQTYLASEPILGAGDFDDVSEWDLTNGGTSWTTSGSNPFAFVVSTSADSEYVESSAIDITPRTDGSKLGDNATLIKFGRTVTNGQLKVEVYDASGLIRTQTYTGNNANTAIVVYPSQDVKIRFGSVAGTNFSGTVTNFSVTRLDMPAIQQVNLSLPKSVTDTITWTYTESNATGLTDTGVGYIQTTYTSGGQNRQLFKLQRDRDQVGLSQVDLAVTATWGSNPTKTATKNLTLTARIID